MAARRSDMWKECVQCGEYVNECRCDLKDTDDSGISQVSRQESTGWQPIETAPKDGTPILGWSEGQYAVVQYRHYYWGLGVAGAWADDDKWEPDLWTSLPAPPTGDKS